MFLEIVNDGIITLRIDDDGRRGQFRDKCGGDAQQLIKRIRSTKSILFEIEIEASDWKASIDQVQTKGILKQLIAQPSFESNVNFLLHKSDKVKFLR